MTFKRLKHAADQVMNPAVAVNDDFVVDVCDYIVENIELDGDFELDPFNPAQVSADPMKSYPAEGGSNTVNVGGKLAISKIQQKYPEATPEVIQAAVAKLNDPSISDLGELEKDAYDSFKEPNMKGYGDVTTGFVVQGQDVVVEMEFTEIEMDA